MQSPTVPRPDPPLRLCSALMTALAVLSMPLAAEEAPPARLKSLERQLEITESERSRLLAQAAASARALNAVRGDMIATAKEIQDQEHSLTVLEGRIAAMERDGERLNATLGRRDAQMVQVLMAVERLALRPSDALTVSPLSPADAVRSAILLRAALPSIRQSTTELQGELRELYRLRAEIIERKKQAAAGAAALLEKHRKLDELANKKAEKHETLLARGEDATARMTKIAREAEDLRALFAKLAEEKARRDDEARKVAAQRAEERLLKDQERRARDQKPVAEPAAPAAQAKDPGATSGGAGPVVLKAPPGVEPLGPEKQLAGLPPGSAKGAGDDEEAVTRSFGKARGTMPFPVAGRLTGKYGEAAPRAGEAGLTAKGITITSRAGAQVVAPFDGTVAFAGVFRGYGQLLIIGHSEGYHTLLAGMGHLDAVVGQRVLAGEPVGVMDNEGAPALYVELRRDGQPINPLPWLADRAGKTSG